MKTRKRSTIAITGSTGFLGSTLIEHFSSKGWQVIALSRRPPKRAANVSHVEYDMSGPLPNEALKDVDYLVHTAYIKQDRRHPNAFNENVHAAKMLFDSSERYKLKKVVFMSSMSAHDEAISSYGKQKVAIEKVFSGKRYVNIRAGLIIGDGGIVKQMIEFMKSKHLVPLIDGGNQPLQIIGIDDLVKGIESLLQSNLSGTLTLGTPETYSYKDLYKTISNKLHIRVIYIPIPFFALIGVIKFLSLLPIPLSVNEDNALGLKQLRSFDTSADLRKIGLKPKSLAEALNNIKKD